jgi:hypothetical protein
VARLGIKGLLVLPTLVLDIDAFVVTTVLLELDVPDPPPPPPPQPVRATARAEITSASFMIIL